MRGKTDPLEEEARGHRAPEGRRQWQEGVVAQERPLMLVVGRCKGGKVGR